MATPLSRRTFIGAAGLTAGLGLGGTAAEALPTEQERGRRRGYYREQRLAWAGYRGIANYRIPALAVAPNGDLLASFDERPLGGDAPAPNSILQRRSCDGGRTWKEPTVIQGADRTGDPATQTGYSDPSYVVDRRRGLLFNFHVFSKNQGFWGSQYGSDDADREVLSAALSVSRDSGRTWEQRSVTSVVKPDSVKSTFATSGAGIQLRYGRRRGRLIQQYAGVIRQGDGSEAVQAYSVFSDDHGRSWQMGRPIGTSMDENKVVELSDGTLMMNSRQHEPTGGRWIAYSGDGGETWEDLHLDERLQDPGNNAHLTRAYPDAPRGSAKAKVLLFSNADHAPRTRENGTIRVSRDDGRTWTHSRVFQPGACQYSVIIPLGHDRFALAYEGAEETIVFARLNFDWILGR